MSNENSYGTYSFSYTDENGRSINYTIPVTDDNNLIFWSEVHSHFMNFLSSVFGYDIRDKVSVQSVLSKIDGEEFEYVGNYGGNDE